MVNHPAPKIKVFVDRHCVLLYNEAKETVLYE